VGAGCRYGGWISTRSSLRSRALASVGYRAEHAALARYLALVVNELITAGALPPNGRATELGSPHIRFEGSLAHLGCGSSLRTTPDFSILAASRHRPPGRRLQNYCRDAVKIDRHHGVQIEQIDPLDGFVQSWLHPRWLAHLRCERRRRQPPAALLASGWASVTGTGSSYGACVRWWCRCRGTGAARGR